MIGFTYTYTPLEIEQKIYEYGDNLFPVKFSDYLQAENRRLVGFNIGTTNGTIRYGAVLFGHLSPSDIQMLYSKPWNCFATYIVNTKKRPELRGFTDDVDLFLWRYKDKYNPPNTTINQKDADALIIHELCHWYIDAGLFKRHPPSSNTTIAQNAQAIPNKLSSAPHHAVFHGKDFCFLLAAISEKAANYDSSFTNTWDVITRAIKLDI